MRKAEADYESGTRTLKYAAVTTWLYEKLPTLAKWVLTSKDLDNLIAAAVTEVKEYLADKESTEKTITSTATSTSN